MKIAENSEKYIKRHFKGFPRRGEEMSSAEVAKQAEKYVESYFRDIRKTKLVKKDKGEDGFDFKEESSKFFVEVKGSGKSFKHLQGWYFTKGEYKKAQSCQRETEYEIHLVVGIGSESPEHYMAFGKVLLDKAKKEVSWWLNRKDLHNYDC